MLKVHGEGIERVRERRGERGRAEREVERGGREGEGRREQ